MKHTGKGVYVTAVPASVMDLVGTYTWNPQFIEVSVTVAEEAPNDPRREAIEYYRMKIQALQDELDLERGLITEWR